jgi:segregation and condensation protein A
MYEVTLEKFQGPLDLLLQLIEGEELDITEVSLSRVADQYIARLAALPEKPPEELADFLVVAAKLLYIKSKTLLPFLHWDTEEDEGDLETRLKMYREYVEAMKKIEGLIAGGRFTFVREKPPVQALGFAPPKELSTDKMAEIFREVLRRLEPVVKPPEGAIEKTISIHDKIRHIQELISRGAKVSFHNVLASAATRAEIIVSFLALLELVKQKHVAVSQSGHFEEISLERTAVNS